MPKLNLSVDRSVVSSAKRYAKARGISVSHMVESYLATVSSQPGQSADQPVLRSLRGILKHGSRAEYQKHLTGKYR